MWENKNRNVISSIVAFLLLVGSVYVIVRFKIDSKYKDDFYLTNQYVISFDTGNEVKLESLLLLNNEQINLPVLERKDYTFEGWVDNENNPVSSPYTVKKDETIIALWSKNDYISHTVSFDLNGGYGTYENKQIKEGSTITEPKTPTRKGYIFEGWYNGKTKYNFKSKITKNITLTAHWKVDKNFRYDVSFHLNDGTGKVSHQRIKVGGKATIPKRPTKPGYIFKGWYLNGVKYNFNRVVKDNITLAAYWEKENAKVDYNTVTFDLNSGVGIVETQLIVNGHAAKEPEMPVRNGYTFEGWFLGSSKYNFSNKVLNDIKLTAMWTKNANTTKYYTVKFNTNGSSDIASQKVASGKKVSKPKNPTKDGYKFKGWYQGKTKYDFNKKVKSNLTLTAKWEKYDITKTYKVSFDVNGGSPKVGTQKIKEGKVVSKPVNPSRSGYIFKGWYLNGVSYDFKTKVSSNYTLIAMWEKNIEKYKVKFDLDGGNGSAETQTIASGGLVKKPSNLEKSGYTFKGWYNGNTEYKFVETVTKDMTLKAKWEKNAEVITYYVVKFDTNGGNSISAQTVRRGGKVTKPIDPRRSGYTFKGWYLNGSVFDFNTSITSNITLTASWYKNQSPDPVPIETCTAVSRKNVTTSGVQNHCYIQKCVNSKWELTNTTGNSSITCAAGYEKKYYYQGTTCNKAGTSCSLSSSSTCQDAWYYSCEPIHTLINVPIDSRPVTRSNFEYLVRSVGMNYDEVSSGLDSYSNDRFVSGNYSSVVSSLRTKVSKNNNRNTTVIINTTSYAFGGLGSSRGYTAYMNLESKISNLRSLLQTYTLPRYYVVFIIPRTRPDDRLNDMQEFKDTYSEGLKCYKSNFSSGCATTLTQVTMEWGYLRSFKNHNTTSAWNSLPMYVKNFYNDFERKYMSRKESGPSKYKSVFDQANSYLNSLFSLKSSGYIDELVIGNDDFEIPDYMKYSNEDWIKKDSYGNKIKYSLPYDVMKNYRSRKSSTVNFFAADEINNVIFAREAVRINKRKVNFNHQNIILNNMNKVLGYDEKSSIDIYNEFVKFINYYGNSYYPKPMIVKFVSSSENANSQYLVDQIYKIVDNSNQNVLALQIDYGSFDSNLRNNLVNARGRSIFEVPAISGWNTVTNSIGIGLSRATAYTILDYDLKSYAVSAEYKKRLTNLINTQIISVLEDSIYNNNRNLNTFKSKADELLASELRYSELHIGKYVYNVNSISYRAINPWDRNFEILITPSFNLDAYEK